MDWTDDGIVLSARKYGESSAIAQLLTKDRGRHAGLIRGGTSRKLRGVLQPGNQVAATWRARLSEHLGTLTVEPVRARAANLLTDSGRLAGLSAACAIAEVALPEREPHLATYEGMLVLLDGIEQSESWPFAVRALGGEVVGRAGFRARSHFLCPDGGRIWPWIRFSTNRARGQRSRGGGIPGSIAAVTCISRCEQAWRWRTHAIQSGGVAQRRHRRIGAHRPFSRTACPC